MSAEDQAKVDLLKKQRAAFKGHITYFRNQYNAASTLGTFESLLRRIQLVYDKYSSVQLRIESLDDSAGSDRDNFEDEYGKLESMMLNKIHELKRADDTSSTVSFQNTSVHEVVPNGNLMGIRLPELKLPTFNGIESEWLSFRDVFVDLIHSKNIDATVKFVYLISHIRSGSAYRLIENLPVTSDNYEIAWKALCDRYNNEISIQRVHMKEIYEVKGPLENSSKSLQLFIDHVVKHYNALKSLKVKMEDWDLMLTHHLTMKLDPGSRTDVIKKTKTDKILSFTDLIQILRDRIRLLQALQPNSTQQPSRQFRDARKFSQTSNPNRASVLVGTSLKCSYCHGDHLIVQCSSFTDDKISPQMRFRFIRDNGLCTNCLSQKHSVRDCTNPPCSNCSLKHHTLLHFNINQPKRFRNTTSSNLNHPTANVASNSTTTLNDNNVSVTHSNCIAMDQSSHVKASSLQASDSKSSKVIDKVPNEVVMIGTALVNASTPYGNQMLCRALLDSGSHMNFITADACNFLQATRHPTCKKVSGIGGKDSNIKHKVYLTITSRVSAYNIELKFYVIPKITNDLPLSRIQFDSHSIPVEIELADPYFNVPDRIDLLLGVEVYNKLFKGGHIKPVKQLPPFYDTELGYVVCGKGEPIPNSQENQSSSVSLCSIETLETQLKQFWELETITLKNIYSPEEKLCEEHYIRNVKRLPCGRYSVALPVKSNIDELGTSAQSARRQFLSLEKRLRCKEGIYDQYKAFMSEYKVLGHMIPVSNNIESNPYYLPHHYVIKDSSTTTKLRVVFNASAPSSSHLTLNDCLMTGPTVQQTLFAIILRFRKHLYAFSGDIAKMYRQIRVHDHHQDLQRIWWRDHHSEMLQAFKLCTVTYGTASAPFLATRTLKQLAVDECSKFPSAAKVIENDFYVDDVLTGASTLDEAIKLKSELTQLLKMGGFELRKFQSNHSLLRSEDSAHVDITLILGLSWNTVSDNFEMYLDKLSLSSHCSRRNMLSEICQLFDPLGFCAPIIVTAKLFMQALWSLRDIGWDDPLPSKIANEWIQFKTELLDLKRITVPRCVMVPDVKRVELHGFGDASERAFGCVFYIRATDSSECHHITLVCAKSRVAPLKKQSIPRLELCAALLLAEISTKLVNFFDIQFDSIFLWSDSEITLFRIRSDPHKYATFVANRIAKIQEHTAVSNWHYVTSSLNPADQVSRGMMPSKFLSATSWWFGPEFLHRPKTDWPKATNRQLNSDLLNLDVRQLTMTILNQPTIKDVEIFNRFHSLSKLRRVVSYMLRFYHNAKAKPNSRLNSSINLTPTELDDALQLLIKVAQTNDFGDELRSLTTNKFVNKNSSLRSLSPFLDANGILRVGGRLHNAPLSFETKHQIILASTHPLTKLIVSHEHWKLLHAGPQALLYNLRLTYWIIGGRNLCRTIVNKCIRCFHARPSTKSQIMGNLPIDRVTKTSRPFVIVGIDFCGPFVAKRIIRSKLVIACYICVFVCFTTKAVHLELVMNLSADSFIACLRRFVARRGLCSKIFSDNGTNFIGARSELRNLKKLFVSQQFQHETINYCNENNIEWCTIPPRSPHFGGLWESAVKSAKFHMRRVIGKSCFTLEEYYTLIAQVEACLNSRPLTPMSNDPSDLNALSPGHFIIGSPLTAVIEPSLLDLQTNKLSRFQTIQHKIQNFWARWQVEYLAELQRRYKWQKGQHKFRIGSLILLHDENLPPMKWCLGRIIDTHPGNDGIVRVVSIKTAHSVVKRAVNRISVLPLDED